jgi:hypothetical protein
MGEKENRLKGYIMKKRVIVLLVVGILAVMVAVPAVAFAAQPGVGVNAGLSRAFVDLNLDGVCDNFLAAGGGGYVDSDGDGVCDNLTSQPGPGFVDANGDGVCDNYVQPDPNGTGTYGGGAGGGAYAGSDYNGGGGSGYGYGGGGHGCGGRGCWR